MTAYFFQFIMALIGVCGFSMLFRAPGKLVLLCGLLGGADWIFYLLLTGVGMTQTPATALAIFVLVLVDRAMAACVGVPATVFVVTGIMPVLPGAGIYYTVYNLMLRDFSTAAMKGVQTLAVFFAISVGIVAANLLPQRLFRPFARLNRVTGKNS